MALTTETSPRPKVGRPPLPPEVRRSHPIRAHVDAALHDRAVAYARERELPISHLISTALEALLAAKASR